jgi:hypothetical protein
MAILAWGFMLSLSLQIYRDLLHGCASGLGLRISSCIESDWIKGGQVLRLPKVGIHCEEALLLPEKLTTDPAHYDWFKYNCWLHQARMRREATHFQPPADNKATDRD